MSDDFFSATEPKQLYATLSSYVAHGAPFGLFGEVTQDLVIDKDPMTDADTAQVVRLIGYIAAADGKAGGKPGMSKQEGDFCRSLFAAYGLFSEARTETLLADGAAETSVTEAAKLISRVPRLKLYYAAAVAGVDGLSDKELARMKAVAKEAGMTDKDTDFLVSVIKREKQLQRDLVVVMNS